VHDSDEDEDEIESMLQGIKTEFNEFKVRADYLKIYSMCITALTIQ
jgi:hypothetical protein